MIHNSLLEEITHNCICPECGKTGTIRLFAPTVIFYCIGCQSRAIDPFAIGPWEDPNRNTLDTYHMKVVTSYTLDKLGPPEKERSLDYKKLEFVKYLYGNEVEE